MNRLGLRMTVARLSLATVAGLGCGRTALDGGAVDGSVRNDVHRRAADVEPVLDSGRAAADAQSRSLDAGVSDPSPTCKAGPDQSTSLTVFDSYTSVLSVDCLALSRGRLFTSVETLVSAPPPRGQVASISVATGEIANIDIIGYLPMGLLAYSGGVLVTAGKLDFTSTSWSAFPSDVYRLDSTTQTVLPLANPTGLVSPHVAAVAASGNGEVFWILEEVGTNRDVIAGWDPSTGSTSTVLDGSSFRELLADTSALYWRSTNVAGNAAFLSMPLGGGVLLQSGGLSGHHGLAQDGRCQSDNRS